MPYFIATGFDWEPGEIIDNETFREGPHKNFFLDEVPEHLKETADYLARREAEVRLENLRLERYPAKAARPPEMNFWTPAELHTFLDSLDSGDRLYAMWRVLAFTGLRRGEVAGLRWQDVDLEGAEEVPGRIRVLQQYKPNGKGGFVFGPPKSDQSRRTVDLDPPTAALLRDHRRIQLDEWTALGLSGQPTLVFTNLEGGPVRPDSGISKRFDRLASKTDLARIRLHDLRHTHCAHLIAAGADLKAISVRLGHASVSFTLDRYGHLLPGRQAEAAARVAAMVDGAGSA